MIIQLDGKYSAATCREMPLELPCLRMTVKSEFLSSFEHHCTVCTFYINVINFRDNKECAMF